MAPIPPASRQPKATPGAQPSSAPRGPNEVPANGLAAPQQGGGFEADGFDTPGAQLPLPGPLGPGDNTGVRLGPDWQLQRGGRPGLSHPMLLPPQHPARQAYQAFQSANNAKALDAAVEQLSQLAISGDKDALAALTHIASNPHETKDLTRDGSDQRVRVAALETMRTLSRQNALGSQHYGAMTDALANSELPGIKAKEILREVMTSGSPEARTAAGTALERATDKKNGAFTEDLVKDGLWAGRAADVIATTTDPKNANDYKRLFNGAFFGGNDGRQTFDKLVGSMEQNRPGAQDALKQVLERGESSQRRLAALMLLKSPGSSNYGGLNEKVLQHFRPETRAALVGQLQRTAVEAASPEAAGVLRHLALQDTPQAGAAEALMDVVDKIKSGGTSVNGIRRADEGATSMMAEEALIDVFAKRTNDVELRTRMAPYVLDAHRAVPEAVGTQAVDVLTPLMKQGNTQAYETLLAAVKSDRLPANVRDHAAKAMLGTFSDAARVKTSPNNARATEALATLLKTPHLSTDLRRQAGQALSEGVVLQIHEPGGPGGPALDALAGALREGLKAEYPRPVSLTAGRRAETPARDELTSRLAGEALSKAAYGYENHGGSLQAVEAMAKVLEELPPPSELDRTSARGALLTRMGDLGQQLEAGKVGADDERIATLRDALRKTVTDGPSLVGDKRDARSGGAEQAVKELGKFRSLLTAKEREAFAGAVNKAPAPVARTALGELARGGIPQEERGRLFSTMRGDGLAKLAATVQNDGYGQPSGAMADLIAVADLDVQDGKWHGAETLDAVLQKNPSTSARLSAAERLSRKGDFEKLSPELQQHVLKELIAQSYEGLPALGNLYGRLSPEQRQSVVDKLAATPVGAALRRSLPASPITHDHLRSAHQEYSVRTAESFIDSFNRDGARVDSSDVAALTYALKRSSKLQGPDIDALTAKPLVQKVFSEGQAKVAEKFAKEADAAVRHLKSSEFQHQLQLTPPQERAALVTAELRKLEKLDRAKAHEVKDHLKQTVLEQNKKRFEGEGFKALTDALVGYRPEPFKHAFSVAQSDALEKAREDLKIRNGLKGAIEALPGGEYVWQAGEAAAQVWSQAGDIFNKAIGSLDYKKHIQALPPGGTYNARMNVQVMAEFMGRVEGQFSVNKGHDGKFRLNVSADLAVGVYGELGARSPFASATVFGQADAGLGGGWEMTFDNEAECLRAVDALGRLATMSAVRAATGSLPAKALEQLVNVNTQKDFELLNAKTSAIEGRISVSGMGMAQAGVGTGQKPSPNSTPMAQNGALFAGVFAGASGKTTGAARLEWVEEPPGSKRFAQELVLKQEMQVAGFAGAVVGPQALQASAQASRALTVTAESRFKVPQNFNMAAFTANPRLELARLGADAWNSKKESLSIAVNGSMGAHGNEQGATAFVKFTGNLNESFVKSGALPAIAMGDWPKAIALAGKQLGNDVKVDAMVGTYKTDGFALSPFVSLFGVGAGIDYQGGSTLPDKPRLQIAGKSCYDAAGMVDEFCRKDWDFMLDAFPELKLMGARPPSPLQPALAALKPAATPASPAAPANVDPLMGTPPPALRKVPGAAEELARLKGAHPAAEAVAKAPAFAGLSTDDQLGLLRYLAGEGPQASGAAREALGAALPKLAPELKKAEGLHLPEATRATLVSELARNGGHDKVRQGLLEAATNPTFAKVSPDNQVKLLRLLGGTHALGTATRELMDSLEAVGTHTFESFLKEPASEGSRGLSGELPWKQNPALEQKWAQARGADNFLPTRRAQRGLGDDFHEASTLYKAVKGTPQETELRALMPSRFQLLDQLEAEKGLVAAERTADFDRLRTKSTRDPAAAATEPGFAFGSGKAEARKHDVVLDGRHIRIIAPEGTSVDGVVKALEAVPARLRATVSEVVVERDAPSAELVKQLGFAPDVLARGSRLTVFPTQPSMTQTELDAAFTQRTAALAGREVWGDPDTSTRWAGWKSAMQNDGAKTPRFADLKADQDFAEAMALYRRVKGTPAEDAVRKLMPERFQLLDGLVKNGLEKPLPVPRAEETNAQPTTGPARAPPVAAGRNFGGR